ncbi:hypothetical protein [Pseudomonas weihenstephanensis]|uniref:hypothetical protein n=1 Tax=Pseudomonas weihenstephanensis TaxID=1608994 RepID=UPI00193B0625|nr:hypothetical protein [Pseudomonas weihenstephanensis]MBM1189335.1 hypothetical protein [Pseudomonas weihenstephanensis]
MTSSNAHSKAPSLLADAQEGSTPNIRPINNAGQSSTRSKKTLYIWLSIIALTLATGVAWVFDSAPQVAENPAEAYTVSSTDAPDHSPSMSEQTPPPMISESAQIFNEAPTEQPTNLISTTRASPPPNKTPPTQAAKPYYTTPASRSANSTASSPRASDVDVLIALMSYIESPDNELPPPTRKALQERIKACPAANTEAGIDCRQRICADLSGSVSLCPSP